MRHLIFALLLVPACERRDSARDTSAADTRIDTLKSADTTGSQAMTAAADRLLGSWTAKGTDAGSNRAQTFTINWTRAPDGSLAGTIAFQGGEQYKVKMVSTGDSTFVYES
jgi:hypothetical protein